MLRSIYIVYNGIPSLYIPGYGFDLVGRQYTYTRYCKLVYLYIVFFLPVLSPIVRLSRPILFHLLSSQLPIQEYRVTASCEMDSSSFGAATRTTAVAQQQLCAALIILS